ncbi:hypothetical protein [Micromonospora sp. B9E7]|uniref:hypothetical protein n=1 Tax=Micromonospora sp. B9E7 TaxID=3153574 RepID=UPI00325E03F2
MTAALAPAVLDATQWQARLRAVDLRLRNSGGFRRRGVSKRHEADNRGQGK